LTENHSFWPLDEQNSPICEDYETSTSESTESNDSEIEQTVQQETAEEEEVYIPRQEIKLDINESNIISGPRKRKATEDFSEKMYKRNRTAFLLSLLQQKESYPGILFAFSTALSTTHMIRQKIHREDLPEPPGSYKEMLKHQHKEGFLAAMKLELENVTKMKTYEIVDRPTNMSVIPVKWVLLYKFDKDGNLDKYKARICARGDLQVMTMEEKRATTLAAKTFRTMMAIAAAFDLETMQFDAVNAFLNCRLDETVYVECPPGFRQQGKVWILNRALYGLRRSPRLWQRELSKTLKDFNLKQVGEDSGLFANDDLVVMFFVDDIIGLYRKEKRQKAFEFRDALKQRYELREMGEVKWFLGVRVLRNRDELKLWLCQDSYIERITHRYNLESMKPPNTPMATEELVENPERSSPNQILHFQQKVGSLLYATVITRPDAAKTANKLSEFLCNPSKKHIEAVDRAISYLYGTRMYAIEYDGHSKRDEIFLCASDAAFADNKDRKSSDAYLCKLFGGAIDWKASKQKTVTTSTTEAELLAISEAGKQLFWWKRLFNAIGFDPEHELSIKCDNKQTIDLLTNEEIITLQDKAQAYRHTPSLAQTGSTGQQS
jgi:reverse transcriptase-like protein